MIEVVIMIEETNGNNTINVKVSPNSVIPIASSASNDDLSLESASEYTDADESMSAPTEYLAEFLSAVMQKDYRKALNYCKLILDFEPNNITAKEFYPLIEEKMRSELIYDLVDLSSDNDSESDSDEYSAAVENQSDEEKCSIDSNKSSSSNSNSPLYVSSSSLCDSNSSYANQVNSFPQTVAAFGESENTTHSYSNSLLEDEDDIDIMMLIDDFDNEREGDEEAHLIPNFDALKLSDLSNGNYQQTSFSDSESPTEPLTLKSHTNLRMD